MCKRYRLCEKIHHDREQLTCDLMMVSAEKGILTSLLDVDNAQMGNASCLQHYCSDAEVYVNMKIGDRTCHDLGIEKAWIEANDKDVEGEWVWGPGDPVSFTGWFDGEPSNSGGNEDCAIIEKGGWFDIPCWRNDFNSACERPYNISALLTYITMEP
ncbi:mannose-binding protein C-like [Argopecten irradians]|uniref:mannose-binding protein C-like n=1 Tax=Argopecten irradians TaxID=31199 RepID=UPI0037203FF9